MIKVYGLKNCDTCRKALKWLVSEDIAHDFIDIRADTPPKTDIASWVDHVGLTTIVNKSSTTWRQLDDSVKDALSEKNAAQLLADNPTLIKRPVFVLDAHVVVGFKDAQKASVPELAGK